MPSPIEIAKRKEREKLIRAGIDPDDPNGLGASKGGDGGGDGGDGGGDGGDDGGGDGGDDRGGDGGGGGGDDTTELQRQIAELRSQLAAANGRAAPTQREADELRRQLREERDARDNEQQTLRGQIEALQAQIDARSEDVDLSEILGEDELKDIDPTVLNAMKKVFLAGLKKAAPKVDVRAATLSVLEEREKNRVNTYRTKVMNDPTRGLHKLGALAYDPEFIAWSREEDNDVDSVVTSLLNATSTEDVDRYARIVAKKLDAFSKRGKAPPANTRTRMGEHMRRGEQAQLTAAEKQAKLVEAKNLSRSRDPADRKRAQEIINSL